MAVIGFICIILKLSEHLLHQAGLDPREASRVILLPRSVLRARERGSKGARKQGSEGGSSEGGRQ